MLNYIQVVDDQGNLDTPAFISNLLTNLSRFSEALPITRELVYKFISDKATSDDINDLKCLAKDFFDTWYASSTELLMSVGKANCLEYFQLFRSTWFVTWPESSLSIIESMGIDWVLTIFRGESPTLVADGIQGISWTTNRSIAEYYASRHPDGMVLSKEVKWNEVLAILDCENEVIVSPIWPMDDK